MLIGIHQSRRIAELTTDEDRRHAIVENQICVCFCEIVKRAGVLVTYAKIQGNGGSKLPAIFGEGVVSPIAKVHLRNAGLTLLDGWETQQQAGKAGAAAIVEAELRGVAIGELVVAAVLEESPHGPDVATAVAAEADRMTTVLPGECVAEFDGGVRHAWEWQRRCLRCR